MLNNRMQNLDTKKEISIQKGDLGHLDTTKRHLDTKKDAPENNYLGTMGPKMNTHTHFYHLGIISQLHRTSVTQGFLAGIILCNSGVFIGTFC